MQPSREVINFNNFRLADVVAARRYALAPSAGRSDGLARPLCVSLENSGQCSKAPAVLRSLLGPLDRQGPRCTGWVNSAFPWPLSPAEAGTGSDAPRRL